MTRRKTIQSSILVALCLLAVCLFAGGLSFSQRLQAIRHNLPISTVSQHRGLSGLIEKLKTLSIKLNNVINEPSEEHLDDLRSQIGMTIILADAFFVSLEEQQQGELLTFLRQDIGEILHELEMYSLQGGLKFPSQAAALSLRLEEDKDALQNFSLHANQVAFDNLSRQSGRMNQLALATVIISSTIALLILIIALLFRLQFRAARLLSKTRERLHTLSSALEQSPVSVMICDPNGIIEYVNPRFREVSGYSEEEALSPEVRMHCLGQPCADFIESTRSSIVQNKFWRGELQNIKKSGEHYWESVSVSPLTDSQGKLIKYIIVKEDITAKKASQKALQLATAQAHQAARAKTEFLANMSHEIRTPMNAILGFADLLGNPVEESVKKGYLQSIISAGKTLLQIINDILDISKIEAGKLNLSYVVFNPQTLIEELAAMFRLDCTRKGVALTSTSEPQDPTYLYCDEIRLRQILFNLVGNAVKFTSSGEISINAEIIPEAGSHEQVTLKLSVRDTGIGIGQDQQESIFAAFEQQQGQSQADFGGTGLGLTISRRLVSLMQGEISVTSALGKGSTFCVTLPGLQLAQNSPPEYQEDTNDSRHNYRFSPSCVLIADDVADNRKLLCEYLAGTGLTTQEASNGKEVLQLLDKQQIDLVLLDLRMPVLNGIETIGLIRQNPARTRLPVIVVTASAMQEQMDEIMHHDFSDYLRKPLDRTTLLNKLSSYLPHSIELATQEEPVAQDDGVTNVFELTQKLDRLQKECDRIKDRGDFQLIGQFAEELLTLAAEHHSQRLLHYAEKLQNGVGAFDIEAVASLMLQFRAMAHQLSPSDEETFA